MEKPICKLIGMDGNVFSIVGEACRVLRVAGQAEQAKRLAVDILNTTGYGEVLTVIQKYVEVE
jgi:hypothetical protein